MDSQFYLYPDGPQQQRLRLGASLVGIHLLEGFDEAIAPFEVEVEEAEERVILESRQELIVRPPIPREKISSFGEALVEFAASIGSAGSNEVRFVDHTDLIAELKERMQAKLNPSSRIS